MTDKTDGSVAILKPVDVPNFVVGKCFLHVHRVETRATFVALAEPAQMKVKQRPLSDRPDDKMSRLTESGADTLDNTAPLLSGNHDYGSCLRIRIRKVIANSTSVAMLEKAFFADLKRQRIMYNTRQKSCQPRKYEICTLLLGRHRGPNVKLS